MKAVQVTEFGSPDVLIYQTLDTPTPAAGEVLVRVEAASVNFADLMRRANAAYPFPTRLPYIPGSEVAGTIEALGEGVSGLQIGMRVFAMVGRDGSTGYAQYALANAASIIPIPPTLTADEACALVVAGATALLTLKYEANVQAGETVIVHSAGGGMGSYAVQLAKLLGAGTVIGTASTPKRREAALSAGADYAIDYMQPDWAAQVMTLTDGRGANVILETTGGDVFRQSLDCLAPFGRIVVFGMSSRQPLQFDADAIMKFFYDPSLNQTLHVFNLGLYLGLRIDVALKAIEELIGYAASGQIKVQVGLVLPLSQAAEAHRLIEARETTGKVILKPWLDV
jgi:NADPH:quinone reductase